MEWVKLNWFKLGVLIALLFVVLVYAYSSIKITQPDAVAVDSIDSELLLQIDDISSHINKIKDDGIRSCEAALYASDLEGGDDWGQQCAKISVDYSEWSTELVLEEKLLPIKGDLLSIRDDFNRLASIGLELVKPNIDERDELPYKISDSVTNIRQHISGLE